MQLRTIMKIQFRRLVVILGITIALLFSGVFIVKHLAIRDFENARKVENLSDELDRTYVLKSGKAIKVMFPMFLVKERGQVKIANPVSLCIIKQKEIAGIIINYKKPVKKPSNKDY